MCVRNSVLQNRNLKRLRKKAKKGMRGGTIATIAFYGPDLSRASKVAVGIMLEGHVDVTELRAWQSQDGDVRTDAHILEEVIAFIETHGARSVVMTDGIFGCPHQQGIDYEEEWCPVCDFWRGRDRYNP